MRLLRSQGENGWQRLAEVVAGRLRVRWAAEASTLSAGDQLLIQHFASQSAHQTDSPFGDVAELAASRDLVSIVIPAYNAAHYLSETLDSLVKQTHPHIQIIVVDDGSTDNTPQVIAGYQRTHGIETIRLGSNRGIACAKNAGIELAQGKWLAFLSADDVFHPQAVTKLLRALYANPDADVAYADFEYFGELDATNSGGRIERLRPVYLPDLLSPGVTLGMCVLFRRSLLDGISGPVDEARDLTGVEDAVLWQDLWRRARFVHVSEVLGKYRIHPGQLTQRIVRSSGYGPLLALTRNRFRETYGTPRRMLLVYPSCCLGGAERITSHLAVGLRRHGVLCEACFLEDGGGLAAWENVCPTAIVDDIRGRRSRSEALGELIGRGQYDIVQYSFVTEMRDALEFADYPGLVIEVSHGWPEACQAHRVRPDVLVSVSEFHARQLRARGISAPIQVIYNGVDAVRYHEHMAALQTAAPPSAGPIVAWAGRLTSGKDVSTFLEVARMIALTHRDIGFWMAGAIGPYSGASELEQVADASQELPNLRFFAGLSPQDMPTFYALAQASGGLLVITSHGEPFGMVAIEAMAAGLPVVARDSGALPELIEDGVSGRLVPELQSASQVAEIVLELLADKQAYVAIADRAFARVSARFQLGDMVRQYWQTYASLLGCGDQTAIGPSLV